MAICPHPVLSLFTFYLCVIDHTTTTRTRHTVAVDNMVVMDHGLVAEQRAVADRVVDMVADWTKNRFPALLFPPLLAQHHSCAISIYARGIAVRAFLCVTLTQPYAIIIARAVVAELAYAHV